MARTDVTARRGWSRREEIIAVVALVSAVLLWRTRDLYRIDLSRLVSKYIDETDKQLRRLFARAENRDAVLFFDDADALYGKRGKVKDSHDCYADIAPPGRDE